MRIRQLGTHKCKAHLAAASISYHYIVAVRICLVNSHAYLWENRMAQDSKHAQYILKEAIQPLDFAQIRQYFGAG